MTDPIPGDLIKDAKGDEYVVISVTDKEILVDWKDGDEK